MDIILQMLGCVALIAFGMFLVGGGALGNSMPTFIAGCGVAVLGAGLMLRQVAIALGTVPSDYDVSFTISGNTILTVGSGIIGVIILLITLRALFK